MGFGNYSHAAHAALVADRASRSAREIFSQRSGHPLMDPKGLKVRESRDSADHPQSLAVVFALDVTGSMGDIPDTLARRELPTFMKLLSACGIADPQLLFMAVGDAHSDEFPLQVGQFESTAELMDQWLTRTYLEGGGGGTGEESYELAYYVLARHTDTDCRAKRGKRGYMFMTGDERPYRAVSRQQVGSLIGDTLDEDIPIEEVIAAAAENYHLFFLLPDLARRRREPDWRRLLGDHVVCLESPADTCLAAAAIVGLTERVIPDLDAAHRILLDNGASKERAAAACRALQPYAELLGANGTWSNAAAARPAPAWWRRLFGDR